MRRGSCASMGSSGGIGALVLALVAFLASAGRAAAAPPARGTAAPAAQASVEETFRRGVEAYRRGAFEEAQVLWRSLLDQGLGDDALARVSYDLGNAAYRRGELLEAIGWYTAATRHAPRHADAWANLELARAQAQLPPADRGDLRSTAARLVSALRPAEARLLVLAVLALLAAVLGAEAFLGGRAPRRLALALALVLVLAAVPWARAVLRAGEAPLLVTATPAALLRSEPRPTLDPIGELEAGDEVRRLDALPGWVRVETAAGLRGWVPEGAVFALPR